MPEQSDMQVVKQYLEQGANPPVTVSEFGAFWRACSETERKEFGDQVRRMTAA